MRMGVLRFRGEEEPGRRDRGANLVEFAILAPFLIIILFGIIEFGYFLGEFNDVRHGAREAARLAAVNAGDNTFLETGSCGSMDLTTGVTVEITDGTTDIGGGQFGDIGDTGTVEVIAMPSSLSGLGLIEIFLPSQLRSTVDFRLEQQSTSWSSFGPVSC